MSLKLEHQTATLKNVNVRKERHGEDKVLSIDLKFSMLVGAQILDRFDPGLEKFLYSNGQVRFPLMGALSWDNEINHTAMAVSGIQIVDGTLRKFTLQPQLDALGNKQVDLTFTASYYPKENNLMTLGELVQETVTIDIDSQELL